MKKLVCALLVMVFLCCSVSIAENQIDVTTMEIDELIALKKSIEEELLNRGEEDGWEIVYPGVYVVGEDILAGDYYLKYIPINKNDFKYDDAETFYKEGDEIIEWNVNRFTPEGNGTIVITLKENRRLTLGCSSTVSGSYFLMKPKNDFPSFFIAK